MAAVQEMPEMLEMSPEARADQIRMLEYWLIYGVPPGGGSGGFPPIYELPKYGGEPDPEDWEGRTRRINLRSAAKVIVGLFIRGNLPEVAYSSEHALPDHTGTVPGGFRIHEASDKRVHQWEVVSSPMPSSWIESSSRRSG